MRFHRREAYGPYEDTRRKRLALARKQRLEREKYPLLSEIIAEQQRAGTWNPKQSEHEGQFFRIRIFKNGNAHLWFTRKDLLEKVNKILADYYGEVIGDGQTQAEDVFADKKLAPARRFGFFPTPDEARDRVLGAISLHRNKGQRPLRILEPSAGTGNLARPLAEQQLGYEDIWKREGAYTYRHLVDCVEIQPHLAEQLTAEGIYNRVINQDFLSLRPDTARLYDVIVMNPPFDLERDIDHVMHAWNFLAPAGRLVAIMSAGTEFRQTRKAIAFRQQMENYRASWIDLPAGSFSSVGTYVNTLILSVSKGSSS
ncbi:class I SAM-dependent methyltransferase [uncultured Nitratireductor sp.]|uniref:class I SAM-dependent methyltransferase n=1 Tax=uncultured Nitratireductor sp. TaxID=520953 RepID=UPI002633097A|nr:class I SAM-dependent methyltransferase [uncultured Nitratireductor sp.]